MDYVYMNGELYHHGIKNQKWGIRRFQNEDGSLTPEGRKRYAKNGATRSGARRLQRDFNKYDQQLAYTVGEMRVTRRQTNKYANRAMNQMEKYGQDDKRAQKSAKKATENLKQMLKDETELKKMEQKTWQMMANAHELGYNVSVSRVARDAHRGMTYVGELMRYGTVGEVLIGNQFKVTPGSGTISIQDQK